MCRRFFLFVSLALLFTSITGGLFGQMGTTTGGIVGQVVDPAGLAVPGAEVTVVNEGTALRRTAITDETGNFVLNFLPVGTYTVTVRMPGFKTYSETGLRIKAGEKANVRYTLEVGAVEESITVAAEAPLINAVDAAQDVGLEEVQLKTLPILRRDISSILLLGPGTGGGGGQISLNGLCRLAVSRSPLTV